MTIEELIKENMPLIKKIASNFYHVPFEDLMQAGTIGILKAYKNYRQNGDVKFSTYAYDYIYGEMYDLSCKERKIKVNKDILRLAKQIHITKNALSQKQMREVSYQEVADYLELSMDKILSVLQATKEMMSFDDHQEENRDLYETIPYEETLSLDEKITLQDSMKTLSKEEQQIIGYRYFKDMTQSETAKKMGMTQVMVSRYETKSLKRLKKYYEVV